MATPADLPNLDHLPLMDEYHRDDGWAVAHNGLSLQEMTFQEMGLPNPWSGLTPAVTPEDPDAAAIDPPHYEQPPAGIDLPAREYLQSLAYFQGNAGKYIIRAGFKPGQTWERDFKKAAWCLDYILEHFSTPYASAPRKLLRTIHPEESTRARIFLAIASGRIQDALDLVQAVRAGTEFFDPTI